MSAKVSPDLILRQAAELQRLEITDERAAELAEDVEAINSTVIDAATELDFDDEPSGFFRLLRSFTGPNKDDS